MQRHGQLHHRLPDGHPLRGRGPQVPPPRQRAGSERGTLPLRVSSGAWLSGGVVKRAYHMLSTELRRPTGTAGALPLAVSPGAGRMNRCHKFFTESRKPPVPALPALHVGALFLALRLGFGTVSTGARGLGRLPSTRPSNPSTPTGCRKFGIPLPSIRRSNPPASLSTPSTHPPSPPPLQGVPPVGQLFPAQRLPRDRGPENVKEPQELHHHQVREGRGIACGFQGGGGKWAPDGEGPQGLNLGFYGRGRKGCERGPTRPTGPCL